MIMIYDGNKTLILESVLKENVLSTENIQQNIMGRIVTNVIVLETVSSAKDGKLETTIAGPVVLKQEDAHVIFDFTKLNIVWAKDVSKEEAEALGIYKKFVKPVQDKFEKLIAEERAKEQQKFNDVIAEQVGVHLQNAGVTPTPQQTPPPAGAPVTAMEVGSIPVENPVAAGPQVQMEVGSLTGETKI
jgi:hypothetical protein